MPTRDPALKRFGANVRAHRVARKLTQEKLAELSELDRTYISSIERGMRNVSLASIVRLAKALRTTAAALSEGVD